MLVIKWWFKPRNEGVELAI